MLKVLDLFSGIGGFSLGLERAGMETVAFCEFDKKAQLVLKKHWPDVPIFDDVRELNGKQFEGQAIDLICGGFPCQPFSVAGKREGKEDDRHLWPEYFRLIQEIRPSWVIGENVAGLINLGLDQVLSDLESENYTVQTFNIPACSVNAPHRRDRLWIVAHSDKHSQPNESVNGDKGCGELGTMAHSNNGQRNGTELGIRTGGNAPNNGGKNVGHSNSAQCEGGSISSRVHQKDSKPSGRSEGRGTSKDVAHTECQRQQGQRKSERSCNTEKNSSRETSWFNNGGQRWERNWDTEPDVGRVANGIPRRVDRLKQLGNAVVPQVVEVIGRAIMEIEAMTYSKENCAKGSKSEG